MTMTHGTAIECHRHDESTISAQKAAKVSIKNARMLLYRGCTEFWTRRLATSCCRCNASLPYYAEEMGARFPFPALPLVGTQNREVEERWESESER